MPAILENKVRPGDLLITMGAVPFGRRGEEFLEAGRVPDMRAGDGPFEPVGGGVCREDGRRKPEILDESRVPYERSSRHRV